MKINDKDQHRDYERGCWGNRSRAPSVRKVPSVARPFEISVHPYWMTAAPPEPPMRRADPVESLLSLALDVVVSARAGQGYQWASCSSETASCLSTAGGQLSSRDVDS